MRIILKNIDIKAYHGIYEHEKQNGNRFSVDVELEVNSDKAAISDNINDTINYEIIYDIVKEEMATRANLLENVIERIFKSVQKRFPEVEEIKIAVSKYNPFGDGQVEKVVVEKHSFNKNLQ